MSESKQEELEKMIDISYEAGQADLSKEELKQRMLGGEEA